jgi:hypothetical protein
MIMHWRSAGVTQLLMRAFQVFHKVVSYGPKLRLRPVLVIVIVIIIVIETVDTPSDSDVGRLSIQRLLDLWLASSCYLRLRL